MLTLWLVPVGAAATGDILFREDWSAGADRWRVEGPAIALIESVEDDGVRRIWQHETQLASGGRVFSPPIAVLGGAPYCLSARVHATEGAGAFLGFELATAAGSLGIEHWMIGEAGQGDGYGGLVVPVSDDPTRWARYAAGFVVDPGTTHVVLMDELWVGAAAGAADFTDILLTEGPCGDAPLDTDPPVDTDDPEVGPAPSGSSHPVRSTTVAGYPPERAGGCGGRRGAEAGLLLLGLIRWRRRAAPVLVVMAGCQGWTDDSGLKGVGVLAPPPLMVEPEGPMSNGEVVLALSVGPDDAWTITTTGRGCGEVAGSAGTGPVEQVARASGAGSCLVRADVVPGDGPPYSLRRRFEVQSSDPDLPPVEVVGGVWRSVLPGTEGLVDAPVVTSIEGPTTFVNGATLELDVTVDVDGALRALVVTFDGWEGGFVVPVAEASGPTARSLWDDTPLRVRVPSSYFRQFSGESLSLGVSGLDSLDRRGAAVEAVLAGREVGTGDVQVGISWGSASDVDLHVIEPDGQEISYASPSSSSGGQLDLDSNAGCSIDGINHENVYWPTGQSPEGTFTVRAELYDGCEPGAAAGSVTMTFCGESSPRVETFSLGSAQPSATWTFDSACGEGKRASGRIRYEDRPATRRGYGTAAFVPAVHVGVRLVRESDAAVLAAGVTDAGGRFELPFTNEGDPGFRVEVQARADDETLRAQVTTLDEELYVWQTEEVFDDAETAVFEGLDVDIPASANGDVLSMFDVARRAIDVAYLGVGRRPDSMISIAYTRGMKPGRTNVSAYSHFWRQIGVAGDPSDPDVYDDWAIAHEMGHFIMANLGASDSPRGDHELTERVDARLAWDEGWATWFASQVMNGSTYIDLTQSSASTVYDIDWLDPLIPRGNEGEALKGPVSEAVVSAVLYDLSDDFDEPRDTVQGRDPSIWWVFRHRMVDPKTDRGRGGRDLVDFLDAWLCADLGDEGSGTEDGLRGNVVGLHELAYDFAPACP